MALFINNTRDILLCTISMAACLWCGEVYSDNQYTNKFVTESITEYRGLNIYTDKTLNHSGNSVRNAFSSDGGAWLFGFQGLSGEFKQQKILDIEFNQPAYLMSMMFDGNCAEVDLSNLYVRIDGVLGLLSSVPFSPIELDVIQKGVNRVVYFDHVPYANFIKTKRLKIYVDPKCSRGNISNIVFKTQDTVPYTPSRSLREVSAYIKKNRVPLSNNTWTFKADQKGLWPLDYYHDLMFYFISGDGNARDLFNSLKEADFHLVDIHSEIIVKSIHADAENLKSRPYKATDANNYESKSNFHIRASTTLNPELPEYSIGNLFDGNVDTAWCSGYANGDSELVVEGYLLGQGDVLFVDIGNGYLANHANHENHGVAKSVELYVQGEEDYVEGGKRWTPLSKVELNKHFSKQQFSFVNSFGFDVYALKFVIVPDDKNRQSGICLNEFSLQRNPSNQTNQNESNAIKRNQTQSNAIKRNQTQSNGPGSK